MILYIIYNEKSDKYYIGVTENLERRIREHNRETSHYTGKIKGEWIVKFYRAYQARNEAFKEEKRLKKAGNRKYLEWYITTKGL